jgi:hypothetical protein
VEVRVFSTAPGSIFGTALIFAFGLPPCRRNAGAMPKVIAAGIASIDGQDGVMMSSRPRQSSHFSEPPFQESLSMIAPTRSG